MCKSDGSNSDEQVSLENDHLNDLYITTDLKYFPNVPPGVRETADPFELSRDEISTMAESIRTELLSTVHTHMNEAAGYFFQNHMNSGKKVRPVMVLLLSRALADHTTKTTSSTCSTLFTQPHPWQRSDLPFCQRRLAQVAEMIHTASLFHDDVIDDSDTRRGVPSAHKAHNSNKVAILAGDFLLSQSMFGLAQLGNARVVQAMATTLSELVSGELMQLRGNDDETNNDETNNDRRTIRLVRYLRKTYYKTASLMANSCKSVALLGEYDDTLVTACYNYGKYIGMAFQLVDDILDYEQSALTLEELRIPSSSSLHSFSGLREWCSQVIHHRFDLGTKSS